MFKVASFIQVIEQQSPNYRGKFDKKMPGPNLHSQL